MRVFSALYPLDEVEIEIFPSNRLKVLYSEMFCFDGKLAMIVENKAETRFPHKIESNLRFL